MSRGGGWWSRGGDRSSRGGDVVVGEKQGPPTSREDSLVVVERTWKLRKPPTSRRDPLVVVVVERWWLVVERWWLVVKRWWSVVERWRHGGRRKAGPTNESRELVGGGGGHMEAEETPNESS